MIQLVHNGDGGQKDDDLVATILRAIDMAKSCRSGKTVDLLKMALLNEGVRLAADLSRKPPRKLSFVDSRF